MKDPELLEEFYEVLAAYNKMNDVQFTFTEVHHDPDVVCCEESTADGYSVWVLKETNERESLCENVYYYEPRVSDLFRLMLDMGTELVEAYVEIDHSYLCDFMYEELCSEYQRRMVAVES
jgi:hypothetical protein